MSSFAFAQASGGDKPMDKKADSKDKKAKKDKKTKKAGDTKKDEMKKDNMSK